MTTTGTAKTKRKQKMKKNKTNVPKSILDALDREKKKPMQLKCGIFDDKLYYGSRIQIGDKIKDIIVFSDRNILVDKETIEMNGITYNYSFNDTFLKSHIDGKSIKKFVEGEKAKSFKEMSDLIYNLNKKYMYYPSDVSHKIITCDIMATYFLPLFNSFGRMVLVAEAGSGKTRQSDLYSYMAFNTFKTSDLTSAVMFRLLESSVVTLIIDDTDNFSKEKMADLMQHFKTGYTKGGYVARMSLGSNKDTIEGFRTYGHVVINNTIGFDSISMDRSKEIELVKSDNKDITCIDPEDEKDSNWKEIRENMFFLAMEKFNDVKDIIKQIKYEVELSGRDLQVCLSVLAIAKLISEEWYNECLSYFKKMFYDRKASFSDGNWGFELCKSFFGKNEGKSIQNKDLAIKLLDLEGVSSNNFNYGKMLNDRSRYVSKYFKKISGIFRVSRNTKGNYTELVNKDEFNSWLMAKGWFRILKEDFLDENDNISVLTESDLKKQKNNALEEKYRINKEYVDVIAEENKSNKMDKDENIDINTIFNDIYKVIRENDILRKGLDSMQIAKLLPQFESKEIYTAIYKMTERGEIREFKPGLYVA